jgi:four helix bundle protein
MAAQSYRDLTVWQRAIELVEAVYRVSRLLPPDERFGLTSQMQRAAVSVPANIAEGYGRAHRMEYVRHLSFAMGSLLELETHLIIAQRLSFLTALAPVWQLSQEVGKMLKALMSRLRETEGVNG